MKETFLSSFIRLTQQVYDVSIRDLALVGGYETTGTIGIKAEGGQGSGFSSLSFQFSNLKFSRLDKGIYVNATNNGEWQFDNVRLDHSYFEGCNTGIHINSYNSGWHISSINFLVAAEDLEVSPPKKTYGIYLERSTYMSINMLIAGGPDDPDFATMLIYVKEHANLNIQNIVAERFREDIFIDGDSLAGTGRNYPIYLMNNTFLNKVTIKDSTVISTGNQFGFGTGDVPAIAKGTSQIYSIGDKFCFEGASCETNKGYELQDSAELIFGTNKYKTEVSTLKLGTRMFANLGSPANGTLYYCSDCQQASTCTGAGSGALAKRIAGGWVCN